MTSSPNPLVGRETGILKRVVDWCGRRLVGQRRAIFSLFGTDLTLRIFLIPIIVLKCQEEKHFEGRELEIRTQLAFLSAGQIAL